MNNNYKHPNVNDFAVYFIKADIGECCSVKKCDSNKEKSSQI